MIFKRLSGEHFRKDEGVAKAAVSFYGKPFKIEILSKGIVRYNASLVANQLALKHGKYATVMRKLIESCMANGLQKGFNRDTMYIRSVTVGRGRYLKRREFKGRGKSGAVWRPYANVMLELQEVSVGK